LELLKANYVKALNSSNSKNFNFKDEEDLLNKTFELENITPSYQIKAGESYLTNFDNIRLNPLSNANIALLTHELFNFKDIPGSNKLTHPFKPHYKNIIGFIIENGKTYVLVTN
jgi:hypothetical protein